MKTEPDFPDGLFIIGKGGLTPEGKPIVVQVFMGLFVLLDPVLKFVVGRINFLSTEELGLFPVSKVKHYFVFLSGEDQGGKSMYNFEFVGMDLLDEEDLTNVILVNVH